MDSLPAASAVRLGTSSTEGEPPNLAALALAIAVASLLLLPCLPLLPGLASLLALGLGLRAYGGLAGPRWLAVLAGLTGGLGLTVALLQGAAALATALGMGGPIIASGH